MAKATQWVVTYTRHKAQKRKGYHDGMLVLECCNSNQCKVLLYDDCGKLLDHRFLRNYEKIESGETLEFDNALVDVGDAIDKESCFSDRNSSVGDMQVIKKGYFSERVNKQPGFTKVKRGKETKKMGSHVIQNKSDVKDAGTKEWHVVYTKQKTKKVKKYLDGILKLMVPGIQQKQVILFSEDGNILEKKYLSSYEDVETNCTVELEGYLVEVGEPKFVQTDSESCMTNSNGSASVLENRVSVQESSSARTQFSAVNVMTSLSNEVGSQDPKDLKSNAFQQKLLGRRDVGPDCNKFMNVPRASVKEPLRNVSQILTVLKKPMIGKGAFLDAQVVDPNLESASSGECHAPDIRSETKCGVHYKYNMPDKENLLKYDVNNECSSSKVSRGSHANKSSRGGSSLEAVKPFSIPVTGSVTHSAKHFQAPKLEFDATVQHLVFPEKFVSQKCRQVFIPNGFLSFASYRHIMSSAVYEEIKLILFDIGNEFHKAKQHISQLNKRRPLCKHGKASLRIVKKDGPNKGRLFYGCPSQVESCLFVWVDVGQAQIDNSERVFDWSSEEMEQAFSCFNINFYADCEIFTRKIGNFFSKKRKLGEYECREEIGRLDKTSTYLKLCTSRNYKRCSHSKGDLWILSSNVNFSKEARDDFVAIGVSDYHGPSADGVLEVSFLEGKPPNMPFKKAYALHGPCIQCEIAMLNILREMQPQSMPLLPLLLQCPKASIKNSPTVEGEKLADRFIIKYNLNEDQAKVVQLVAKWFTNFNSSSPGSLSSKPEICLVHGIFGSGKSYLLTVIIIFLTSTFKDGQPMRILISAATNVAIDRVLSGLLELGFNDFIRVGSIKRIARNILPYSLCTAADVNGVEDATLKEMQERMREASVYERLEIEEELKSLKEGKIAKRKEKLKDVQVVGVTCYSTINPILKGNKFQICILDECSQIPEPLSLLPLSQFGCMKLIAVGDPCQLPPALLGGSDLCEGQDAETAGDHRKYNKNCSFEEGENETKGSPSFHDLRRALFVRLVEVGYEPIMLRTQYRCHPRLITVPNELFYGGRIISGCRENDRPPLLSGMPPLLFWDTCAHGTEVKDSLKSYSNLYEAKMSCELIKMILEYGIPGCQIGVIVLYKSQANLVQELFSQGCSFKRNKRNMLKAKPTKDFECQESKTYVRTKCEDDSFEKHGYLGGEVQISTVDAFQGMEKNIIILSCCRTNGLGFLSSPNRLNVALTRARHHLIVIGKASNLKNSPIWRKLLSDAASTSGSYISTPESGSEIIISIMREHISRNNPSHGECIHLLRASEGGADANKGPDVCIVDAQQALANNKEQSTIYHLGQSQSMQGSHALHIVDIPGVDAGSTSCLYVEDNKESTVIKMTELVDRSACIENRCNYDFKRIYVGGSQTEHEVWSGGTCTDMNEGVVLSKEDQDSLSKKVDPSKDGDFEPGEASNSLLDCQSSSLVDADLFSGSVPSTSLLPSGPISEFILVDDETFSMRQQLEVEQTDRDNPNSRNVDMLLKSTTITASEDGRNDYNRLQEAKDGQISDVEKDELAPTFNLGF